MKTCISSLLGIFLFSSVSFASVRDHQMDMELEAMALVQVMQTQAAVGPEAQGLGGLGDFFKNIVTGLEDIKQQLLDQFDENGNGRIDQGAEFDNFKETVQSIVLLLADSNQNGKIDLEDIRVLTKFVLDQAQEQAKTQLCPSILQQAEAAGWWIRFRPVLNHLAQVCQAG